MGILFSKDNNTNNNEIIIILQTENENLKRKNKSLEDCVKVMQKELNQMKEDYDNIIIQLSNISNLVK